MKRFVPLDHKEGRMMEEMIVKMEKVKVMNSRTKNQGMRKHLKDILNIILAGVNTLVILKIMLRIKKKSLMGLVKYSKLTQCHVSQWSRPHNSIMLFNNRFMQHHLPIQLVCMVYFKIINQMIKLLAARSSKLNPRKLRR